MSTVDDLASDQAQALDEAREWIRQYRRTHDGEKPSHNTFVTAMYSAGILGRDEARHAYHALMGTTPRRRTTSQQKEEPQVIEPLITKPTLVPPTPLEQRVGTLEERVVSLEHALQDAEALIARQHRTIEGVQQVLALVEEFRELRRRYPSVDKTIMRTARHFGEEDYAALFWLADRLGFPLEPNDRTLRQQHFSQGLLVPGR